MPSRPSARPNGSGLVSRQTSLPGDAQRREGDSSPRNPCGFNCFQVWCTATADRSSHLSFPWSIPRGGDPRPDRGVPRFPPLTLASAHTVPRRLPCPTVSFLHPERLRECKRCGHRWYAEEYRAGSASPPLIAPGLTARDQRLARQTIHQQRIAQRERWMRCAACGSKKVRTVDEKKEAKQLAAEAGGRRAAGLREPPAPLPLPPPPTNQTTPPAGWYPDPWRQAVYRWWNGHEWTAHVSLS